jgi:PAS domain-containing protein
MEVSQLRQSDAIRALIPFPETVEAMLELEVMKGGSGANLAFAIGEASTWLLEQTMRATATMKNAMWTYPIPYQINLLKAQLRIETRPYYKEIAKLFIIWSRAAQEIPGYKFEEVAKGKFKTFIARGPDDDPERIEQLKKDIVETYSQE